MMSIPELLDQLDDLQLQKDALQKEQQALMDSVLTPEIIAKLDDIRAEFEPKLEQVNTNIQALEGEIKPLVVEAGESVRSKNGTLLAVYVNGRTSWDSKKLEGLMMVIPQVQDARKVGEPSVTIRRS